MSKMIANLSNETISAIGAWSSKSVGAENAKTKATDGLYADGITAAMLVAPKGDESTTLYDSVKVAVVLGFTATVQALLKKDTKGLSDPQKKEKRYWGMQIGSKLKDLRNALTRREHEGDESEGATKKTSFDARLKRDLAKYIAQIEKLEAASFSVVEMLKHLKSAVALIK